MIHHRFEMKRVAILLLALSGCSTVHVRWVPPIDPGQSFIECAIWNAPEQTLVVATAEDCAAAIQRARERAISEGRDPGEVSR